LFLFYYFARVQDIQPHLVLPQPSSKGHPLLLPPSSHLDEPLEDVRPPSLQEVMLAVLFFTFSTIGKLNNPPQFPINFRHVILYLFRPPLPFVVKGVRAEDVFPSSTFFLADLRIPSLLPSCPPVFEIESSLKLPCSFFSFTRCRHNSYRGTIAPFFPF